ncbi:unnamed protein product [Paramecium pentaurelia]|uniref:Uncharacterized protein n=1 Tax=Paramecium pentaurelia TaxID=43138 RepID=A0A8S1Y264_9CILI|nr:unnamed protein product [Paramecium pentaurelia]
MIYYLRLSNIQKQYNACLEMQKYSEESSVNYKLQEIECLIQLDQFESALQILEELTNQQYLLDDIQYVRLEMYRIYLEKSWLETAVEIQKYYFKVQMLFQRNMLITKINSYFSWIFYQFNYTAGDIKNDVNFPEPLEFYYRKILQYFGIKTNDPKEIIQQLEQGGADKYGIRQLLLILMQTISLAIKIEEQFEVDEFFELAIQYFQQNNLSGSWDIYYYYSIKCQKKLQYQKSLFMIHKAMELVDKNNNLELLQTLFQQMYCEIKLDQCQEYQSTLTNILIIIKQVQSSKSRLLLIQRVQRLLYIMFLKQQYSNQIFIIIQQYLQSETDTEILSFLYKLEWETILTYQHPQSLNYFFNNKMINIYLNSNNNDIDMLKCLQNIAVVSRQIIKFDQNIENQKVAVNSSQRYIQSLIIFEDIFNQNQTKTLDLENEILRLANLNKQFKQDQNFKQVKNMLIEYFFNNYKQLV